MHWNPSLSIGQLKGGRKLLHDSPNDTALIVWIASLTSHMKWRLVGPRMSPSGSIAKLVKQELHRQVWRGACCKMQWQPSMHGASYGLWKGLITGSKPDLAPSDTKMYEREAMALILVHRILAQQRVLNLCYAWTVAQQSQHAFQSLVHDRNVLFFVALAIVAMLLQEYMKQVRSLDENWVLMTVQLTKDKRLGRIKQNQVSW